MTDSDPNEVIQNLRAELAAVKLDAGRMHYLGNVVRSRTSEEQSELNALARRYPPIVEPPPSGAETADSVRCRVTDRPRCQCVACWPNWPNPAPARADRPAPTDAIEGAISFLRDNWQNNGAEGESVNLVCDQLELRLADFRDSVNVMVPFPPEPGTDMARVMIANASMRRQRDQAQAQITDAWVALRKLVECADSNPSLMELVELADLEVTCEYEQRLEIEEKLRTERARHEGTLSDIRLAAAGIKTSVDYDSGAFVLVAELHAALAAERARAREMEPVRDAVIQLHTHDKWLCDLLLTESHRLGEYHGKLTEKLTAASALACWQHVRAALRLPQQPARPATVDHVALESAFGPPAHLAPSRVESAVEPCPACHSTSCIVPDEECFRLCAEHAAAEQVAPLTREQADEALGEELERHPVGGHGRQVAPPLAAKETHADSTRLVDHPDSLQSGHVDRGPISSLVEPSYHRDAWLVARSITDHFDWKPNYSDVRAAAKRIIWGPPPHEREKADAEAATAAAEQVAPPPVEPKEKWDAAHPDANRALHMAYKWSADDIQADSRGMSLHETLKAYPEAAAAALRRMRDAAAHYLDELRGEIDDHHYTEILHHAGHVWFEMNGMERLTRAYLCVLRNEPDPEAAEQAGAVGGAAVCVTCDGWGAPVNPPSALNAPQRSIMVQLPLAYECRCTGSKTTAFMMPADHEPQCPMHNPEHRAWVDLKTQSPSAPAMFAIGSLRWPGISKITEESGELQQVIGKLLATGGEVHHWDGSNLRDRLIEEVGDVLAAVWFVEEVNGLTEAVRERARMKLRLFHKWHGEWLPLPVSSQKAKDQ